MKPYADRVQGHPGLGAIFRLTWGFSGGTAAITHGGWTIKDWLKRGDIESVEELGGGVNESKLVKIRDDGRAVFKPNSGQDEDTALWYGHSVEQATNNEIAAAHLGEVLGWQDIIPAVVEREIYGEVGSLMQYWEDSYSVRIGVGRSSIASYNEDEVRRAAIFDVLIANQDRHDGNYMITASEPYNIRLIDHGFSFVEPGNILNRSRMVSTFFDSELKTEELEALKRLGEAVERRNRWTARLNPEVESKLVDLIGRTRTKHLKERLGTLLGEGKIRFPETYADWNDRLR